jgi:hypothetical protein
MTVGQKIEDEGKNITATECHSLFHKYMKLDARDGSWNRLKMIFWIRYMRRRCGILVSSERFNKNVDKPNLGSITLQIMLDEVEQALANDHNIDWNSMRHEQMVYRKSRKLVD